MITLRVTLHCDSPGCQATAPADLQIRQDSLFDMGGLIGEEISIVVEDDRWRAYEDAKSILCPVHAKEEFDGTPVAEEA